MEAGFRMKKVPAPCSRWMPEPSYKIYQDIAGIPDWITHYVWTLRHPWAGMAKWQGRASRKHLSCLSLICQLAMFACLAMALRRFDVPNQHAPGRESIFFKKHQEKITDKRTVTMSSKRKRPELFAPSPMPKNLFGLHREL